MAKLPYVPATIEIVEKEKPKKADASLRLPFGLCKKYGIELPDTATPRDAWNALKGIGISPGDEYRKFFGDKDKDGEKDTNKNDENREEKQNRVFSNTGKTKHFTYDSTFTETYAREQFDAGNDYCKEIVLNVVDDSQIIYQHGKRDCCYSGSGLVYLTVDKEYGTEKSSYEKGEVFYHESFHAIDGAYSETWGYMLSNTYRDESGKTLYDTLRSEKRSFNSERQQEIREARDKEIDQLIRSEGTDIDKIESDYNTIQKQLRATQFGSPEYKAIYESSEYKKAKINYSTLEAKRMVYASKFNKKYGFISDIMSQYNNSIGMGHSSTYWKKDKFHSSSEFFAEVGACKATNPEALNVVKKYFPKSVAFAEMLIEGIKTGKIKKKR
jgi:hypothetical protein